MTVSICIIAYNEEKAIGGLLSQVKKQTYPHAKTEVVLVDGGSEDNTKQILEHFKQENHDYIQVQVLDNPKRSQASGWNVAICHAVGDIIIRVDAHAEIPSDFIEQNVRLMQLGENVCGGSRPTKILEPTPFKETLFLAEESMFGSSIAGYRRKTEQDKQYVSSLFHGAYRREVFEKVGGFNESLGRTEDNELHYRIRQAGYQICQGKDIVSYQYIRGTLGSMLKQKFGNGKWIGLTVGVCPQCLSIFHFVPFCFVLAILIGTVLSVIGAGTGLWILSLPLIALACVYGLADLAMTVTAILSAKKKQISQLLLPFIFFMLHVAYGVGTVVGLLSMPFWKAKLDGSAERRIQEIQNCVKQNSGKVNLEEDE